MGDHRVIKDLIPMDEAGIGLCGWLQLCFAALFCSDLTVHIVGVYHFGLRKNDGGDYMLLNETLEAFRKGNLELWCPKMTIRKQESDKLIEYSGSGLIRQNQERRLEFVLIECSLPSLPENLKRMLGNTGEVGKLLQPDKYYSLEATELSGWIWKADRLLVSNNFGTAGSIALGDIYVLEHMESSESQNTTIKLEIFSNAKLPLAEATKKTVSVGTDESVSWQRNMARFKVGQFDLTITNEHGVITVVATSENESSPEYFETRIIEALQYVASRTLSWGILQKTTNQNCITCLRSQDAAFLPTQLSLPIDYNHADLEGKWVWLLLGKYLEHIYDFKGEDGFQMHPISAWLHYARNTSAGPIFTRGLGLGITVEGILECEFSKTGTPSIEYADALDEMVAHVNSFAGDENVRARTLGALYAMRTIRAKDRLLSLQAAGIVRADDVKAWDAIRNRGAHARPPEREERQEWIDNCFKTEVLLNHLIFHAIGYEGEFTDYGTRNWPQSRYTCSSASLS